MGGPRGARGRLPARRRGRLCPSVAPGCAGGRARSRLHACSAPATAAAVIACLALAVATARPVLEAGERSVRADSEVVFVVDVSRSMLAASSPSAPTRLDRARAAVLRLRAAVGNVPSGVAGLTDRVLPYSFPSPDRASFADGDRPLGRDRVTASAPRRGHRARCDVPGGAHRARPGLLLGGDRPPRVRRPDGRGEPVVHPGRRMRRTCAFLFVRIGGVDERIFAEEGSRSPDARFPSDAGYRPDPSAGATLERLAAATGGRVWPLSGLDDAGECASRGGRRGADDERSDLLRVAVPRAVPRRSRACPDGRSGDRGGTTTSVRSAEPEDRPVPLSR